MRRRTYLGGCVVPSVSATSGCISMADLMDVETPAQVRVGNWTDESQTIAVRVEKVRGSLFGDDAVGFDDTFELEPAESVTSGAIDEPGEDEIVAQSNAVPTTASGEISRTDRTDCNRVRIPVDVFPVEIRVIGVETTLVQC